ncbi:MAG: hypothetical protein WCR72_04795 [Bacteroidota bacterium]
MKYKVLFIGFLTFLAMYSYAQKPIHVKGTSQVRVENNMSREQAREKAEDLAIGEFYNLIHC